MLKIILECLIVLMCFVVVRLTIFLFFHGGVWIGGVVPRMLMKSRITWKIGYLFFTKIFHGLFLLKCAGFVISAAGPIVPLILAQRFFPGILERDSVLIGVFLACLEATLIIMHDVHLMKIPDFRSAMIFSSIQFKINIAEFDKSTLMRLARTYFTDYALPNFLTIIVCYGVVAYCAEHLNWLDPSVHSNALQSPLESVAAATRFLRVVAGNPFSLGGVFGATLTGFFGICILLYTMFFISLASKLIDEDLDSEKINEAQAEAAARMRK